MVEVGVWRPYLAAHVLAGHPSVRVILVDPWRTGVAGCGRMGQWPQDAYDAAYEEAVALAHAYPGRCDVWRRASARAVREMVPGSADLVFLDADHSERAVRADLQRWWPIVAPGGYLGGHDYGHPDHPGVRRAVDAQGAEVRLDADYTWWMQR